MSTKVNGTKEQRHTVANAILIAKNRSDIICETVDSEGFSSVWYYGFDEKTGILYAGGAVNAGIIHEVEMPYDYDCCLEDNLAELDALIHEKTAARLMG